MGMHLELSLLQIGMKSDKCMESMLRVDVQFVFSILILAIVSWIFVVHQVSRLSLCSNGRSLEAIRHVACIPIFIPVEMKNASPTTASRFYSPPPPPEKIFPRLRR